ncbi:hypothetical protein F4802DRAFT_612215 [Xylaria palmicola]|nr:hypothetical protein F4802DRAFT_612215 [Xylaria palmicola]
MGWVLGNPTLTFQLAGVFHLSTLAIGLFALGGISPVFLNPLVSRLVTSRIHTHGTLLVALLFTLATVLFGTFVGTFSLAGPIAWTLLGDLGMNTVVVANRMAISAVDPTAHNAVNAVYMVFTFGGQLFGTAVGNTLYAKGGWTWSGALNIAQLTTALLLLVARGPHEEGWVGWSGGWDMRRSEVIAAPSSSESRSNDEEKQERPVEADLRDLGNGAFSASPSAPCDRTAYDSNGKGTEQLLVGSDHIDTIFYSVNHLSKAPTTLLTISKGAEQEVNHQLLNMITGLHHINLVVPPDTLDDAAAFYGTTLGLTSRPVPALQKGTLLWFDIGTSGQQVHVAFGQPEDFAFDSRRHPCFRVADGEQLLELQRKVHAHLERGGPGAPRTADRPGDENSGAQGAEYPQRFFARDYAGNRLEFTL